MRCKKRDGKMERERDELIQRQANILRSLSVIPKKILSLHGRDNLTEFVMHDICQENCFNIQRAAYFVNNPDFNCLKGVVGVSIPEVPQGLWTDIWRQNEMFSTYMRNSPFNRKVRNFSQCSLEGVDIPNDEIIEGVSRNLGIKNPSYFSVDMKHGNHGLFVYEGDHDDDLKDRHLVDGVSLLGFCPIF